MSWRKNVKPYLRGISRSKTMTSGHVVSILCIAMMGSAATATLIPGSLERSALMNCLTTAESSTTSV